MKEISCVEAGRHAMLANQAEEVARQTHGKQEERELFRMAIQEMKHHRAEARRLWAAA